MNLKDVVGRSGREAMLTFLGGWHGPPEREPRPSAASALPDAVQAFAADVSRWPHAIAQNTLAEDTPELRDGDKRVFYIENQAVYLWATDGLGTDPVVWGRYNEPGEPWQAEREPLSRFLLQILMMEAVFGADRGASATGLPLTQLHAVLEPLERLPLGSWRWPGEPTWLFGADDVLAMVSANTSRAGGPADQFDVWLAARSPEAIGYLRSITNVTWDRLSF